MQHRGQRVGRVRRDVHEVGVRVVPALHALLAILVCGLARDQDVLRVGVRLVERRVVQHLFEPVGLWLFAVAGDLHALWRAKLRELRIVVADLVAHLAVRRVAEPASRQPRLVGGRAALAHPVILFQLGLLLLIGRLLAGIHEVHAGLVLQHVAGGEVAVRVGERVERADDRRIALHAQQALGLLHELLQVLLDATHHRARHAEAALDNARAVDRPVLARVEVLVVLVADLPVVQHVQRGIQRLGVAVAEVVVHQRLVVGGELLVAGLLRVLVRRSHRLGPRTADRVLDRRGHHALQMVQDFVHRRLRVQRTLHQRDDPGDRVVVARRAYLTLARGAHADPEVVHGCRVLADEPVGKLHAFRVKLTASARSQQLFADLVGVPRTRRTVALGLAAARAHRRHPAPRWWSRRTLPASSCRRPAHCGCCAPPASRRACAERHPRPACRRTP